MIFSTFCLALVVYVEARGEPIDGQLLVAEVVMNRTREDQFPDDACAVAFDHKQFSGLNEPISLEEIFADPAWATSVAVATETLSGSDLNSGATYYHTVNVKPYWSEEMILLGMYGNHVFYKDQ